MPRRTRLRLTKSVIDRLSTDRPGGQIFRDSVLPGFFVKVFPSGSKSFGLDYYAPDGKRHVLKIGNYGAKWTPDKARLEADRLRSDAKDGIDPLARRESDREATQAALTVRAWVQEYLTLIEGRKKPSSIRQDRMYLYRLHQRTGCHPSRCPCFTCRHGDRRLVELTIAELERDFARQKEGQHHTRANRWLAAVRACLQAAWRRGLIAENPAMRIKPLAEGVPRSRVLSDDELDRLVSALARMEVEDPVTATAFRILLETGCRRGEVLTMRWSDLDLTDLNAATWRLPSPKGGHPEVKPLTRRLAAVLDDLPHRGEFVIPGRHADRPRSDLKRPWDRLREEAQIEGLTIHDLRRTFGLAVARKVGLHMASRLLGHKDVRLTARVYAPFDLDLLRTAAETVAADRAKVIPLRPVESDENGGV